MKRGLFLPPFGELAHPVVLAQLATEAEEAGWDGVFVWDHVDYRPPVTHVTDPWTALAAIALATERVVIGSLVTPIARRRLQVLARQIAAVASLAEGRFVFGAGLGSDAAGRELSRFGDETDDRRRAAMLDEGLPVLRALLRGERVNHSGEFFTARDTRFLPSAPVPFWIAARWPNRRPLARAAKHDGAFVIDVEVPEELRLVVDQIRALRGTTNNFEIVVRSQDYGSADRWGSAGATWWLADFDPFTVSANSVRQVL